jgi:hypothetical protein
MSITRRDDDCHLPAPSISIVDDDRHLSVAITEWSDVDARRERPIIVLFKRLAIEPRHQDVCLKGPLVCAHSRP